MADDVPAFDDIPSFDDLPDAAGAQAQPTESRAGAVPQFDDIPDFDALPDHPSGQRPAPEGPIGSALREAAHGIIPAVVGTVAAGAAGALGTAVAPGVGTLAGGVAGFVGGSMAADAAQEAGLHALGFDDSQQRAANQEANPKSSFVGGLAPAVATMNPFTAAETIGKQAIQRGAGAAMMGGFEAGGEAVQGENLSPEKIAIAAATGAVFPAVNRVGAKLMGAGERMVPGRPNRTANTAADQAHADVDDPNAEIDAANSSLAQSASTDPQPTIGNPQSAPERTPRDYGKGKEPVAPENDMLSQGDIAPDTAAALADPNSPPQSSPGGAQTPIPGFDDHPSGMGQAPRAPEPVRSEEGLAEVSRLQREAEANVRAKGQAQQLDQEPGTATLDVERAATPVGPPKAAAAINQSKRKLGLKKMPEPSVEAGFPQEGEPVAMGANDVPKPMPEFKGEAPINDSITDAQKIAGNYPKARARDFGKPQTVETHAGDIRRSKPGDPPWEVKVPYDYGDFKLTKGADGDPIDFARPPAGDPAQGDKHFVIDQKNATTGKFDEHKIFTYYKDEAAARDAYERGFSDGKGPDRLGAITEVDRPTLVKLLAKATKTAWSKPYKMQESAAAKTAAKPAVERAVAKDLIAKLEAAGQTEKANAIRALPEDQILAGIAGKRTRKYGVGTGASAGYPVEGIVNAEGKPITANTKIKAQERSAKHKEVQNWFAESAPKKAEETNGELLDRIKPGPGRGDLEGWAPTHKPAEWLWAREASKLLKKPTKGAIEKFRKAESMLRGEKEDVDNYRDGNRVEADIARSRRGGDEAVAKAEASNVDLGRNNVEDDLIAAIDAKRTPINTAADIVAAERGKGKEIAAKDSTLAAVKAADNSVTAKRKAEAAALAGKKSAVANVLPEGAASKPTVKKGIEIDAGERARIMEALNTATKKAASRSADLDITAPIEKGPSRGNDLVDMVAKFAGDEGGSLDVRKLRADLGEAFKTTPVKSYIAKKSNGPHDDYVRSLSDDLHKINQEDKSHAIGIKQAIAAMPKELDAAMRERLYHARDADSAHVDLPYKQPGMSNLASLPAREQKLYRDHLRSILDQNDQFVANIRAIDPDRMGPDVEHHISRIVKGETDKYNVLSNDDPTQPQYNGIGVNADAAKSRKYYALEDAKTGARHVISPTDSGFVKWDKYKREQIKDPSFEFEDGKTHKIGPNDYVMRQATTKEIEANARGLDGGKKPMQYYKDAGMAATLSNLQLGSMARHLAELHRISQTPEFEKLTTRNAAKADERGWKQSTLPNFKGTFMHPDLKAVFDDYAGHPSSPLRDFNNWVTKALFWMPTAHINNVGTHWFVGRGFDNVTPKGVKSLLLDTPKAIKSVVNQDAFQRELRSAGAGTVYGGVLTRDMAGQIGKAFEQDVSRNPSKWGPIADKLGVPLHDLGSAVYRWSSKTMWAANDVFLTQRVMELQRKGMDLKEAIADTERDIPNYRIPIKVIGSGEKGRMLSRAMQDPLITSFGRYHYGMMNSYANIVKDALGTGSTAGDRLNAVGKLMALGLLVTAVYPALDKLHQLVTGNDNASAQRRGPTAIPHHIVAAFQGKEDASAALRSTLTLPPLTTSFLETLSNKDFRGKPIVEPGDLRKAGQGDAKAAGRAVLQEGEHAARGLVSPLNTLETAAKKDPNQSALGAAGAAIRDQALDIKNPSQKATKYERMIGIKTERDARTRFKQGGAGIIEGGYNKLTGNR